MGFDLTRFTLADMTACGVALRRQAVGAGSMEAVADAIVRYLYDQFVDPHSGERALALVRCFKTHPYADLDSELRAFARAQLGSSPPPEMNCLVLLATVGDRPEWCARRLSEGHQAVPLASEEMVERFPMISNLIQQFGLEITTVLKPEPPLLVDLEQRNYNVFYVGEAAGSPYVTAQEEFVASCGIASVLGFGGMLPSGHLFAVILFSKVPIPRETAAMFRTLALSAKLALLPFDDGPIFRSSAGDHGTA